MVFLSLLLPQKQAVEAKRLRSQTGAYGQTHHHPWANRRYSFGCSYFMHCYNLWYDWWSDYQMSIL